MSVTTEFPVHTKGSAPARSRPVLEQLERSVGAIPNLAAIMSESPTLLGSFVSVREATHHGTFDPRLRELLSLANAAMNGCTYCTAIHATFALAAGVEPADVEAVRSGGLPADARQAAAVRLSRALLVQRGAVTESEMQAFLGAGFERQHALEIVAVLAASLMANYSGRLTHPVPDDAIRAQYRR